MNGLLIVDKPAGMTSHDVVARVRRWTRVDKVGHAGTLDPFATGVLLILLGRATRLASFLTLQDKEYDAELRLGATTDTLDLDGQVLEERPVPPLTPDLLAPILERYRGVQMQMPPAYSAIKVGGKAAYRYARAGQEVALEPREVRIDRLELLELDGARVRILVSCSKGTYIRSLARDIGEALGCGAHLQVLRRLRTGPFDLSGALTLEGVQQAVESGQLEASVVPPVELVPELPRVQVTEAQALRVEHGNSLEWEGGEGVLPEEGLVRLCLGDELLAVAARVPRPDPGRAGRNGGWILQPRIVLRAAG